MVRTRGYMHFRALFVATRCSQRGPKASIQATGRALPRSNAPAILTYAAEHRPAITLADSIQIVNIAAKCNINRKKIRYRCRVNDGELDVVSQDRRKSRLLFTLKSYRYNHPAIQIYFASRCWMIRLGTEALTVNADCNCESVTNLRIHLFPQQPPVKRPQLQFALAVSQEQFFCFSAFRRTFTKRLWAPKSDQRVEVASVVPSGETKGLPPQLRERNSSSHALDQTSFHFVSVRLFGDTQSERVHAGDGKYGLQEGKTKERRSLLFRKPNGINWSCIRDAAFVCVCVCVCVFSPLFSFSFFLFSLFSRRKLRPGALSRLMGISGQGRPRRIA